MSLKKKQKVPVKGRLLFEEDRMRYSERHSNLEFIFGFAFVTSGPVVGLVIILLLFDPGLRFIDALQISLRLFMIIAYVVLFGYTVRGDGPMKFYENGFEIQKMGKPQFFKYADFQDISQTRTLMGGEPKLKFKRPGRFKGSILIGKPVSYMGIYLLSIREKMKAGDVGRNRDKVSGIMVDRGTV